MSVYEGIMEGLGEALAHAEGRRALRTTPVFEPVRDYRPDEIKQLRTGLGMTQVVFAGFLGVSPKTVEAWEAGRNRPEGPGPPPLCPAPARPPAARPAQTELNEQTRRSLFRARRVLVYRAVTAPAPAAGRRSAVPSAPPC